MTASHTKLRQRRLAQGICPDCKDRDIEPGTSSCKECKIKRWKYKHHNKDIVMDANPDLDIFAYVPGPLDAAIAQAEIHLKLACDLGHLAFDL